MATKTEYRVSGVTAGGRSTTTHHATMHKAERRLAGLASGAIEEVPIRPMSPTTPRPGDGFCPLCGAERAREPCDCDEDD